MIHNSKLFNYQIVINAIRDEVKNGKKLECELFLDDIAEDAEFEDLPLYKEYLFLFHVEHDLEELGLGVHFRPGLTDFDADCLPLLRLIAASFSSTYELEYDDETNSVNLIITSVSQGKSVTKKLHDLWHFQISRLFEIYIEEQLNLEAVRLNSETEKEEVEKERKMKLLVFHKKIQQLRKQIEKKDRMREDQKESSDILSDLEDLLKS